MPNLGRNVETTKKSCQSQEAVPEAPNSSFLDIDAIEDIFSLTDDDILRCLEENLHRPSGHQSQLDAQNPKQDPKGDHTMPLRSTCDEDLSVQPVARKKRAWKCTCNSGESADPAHKRRAHTSHIAIENSPRSHANHPLDENCRRELVDTAIKEARTQLLSQRQQHKSRHPAPCWVPDSTQLHVPTSSGLAGLRVL